MALYCPFMLGIVTIHYFPCSTQTTYRDDRLIKPIDIRIVYNILSGIPWGIPHSIHIIPITYAWDLWG